MYESEYFFPHTLGNYQLLSFKQETINGGNFISLAPIFMDISGLGNSALFAGHPFRTTVLISCMAASSAVAFWNSEYFSGEMGKCAVR